MRALMKALALLGFLLPALAHAQRADATVFAAASLKTALDAAVADYEAATGRRVLVSYAASSALARQIESGAPADLFISADRDWMDHVAARGLIRPDTRRDLLSNRIVLVAPASDAKPIDLKPGALAAALKGGRLAMAAVESVPAGKYGKAALEHLNLWGEVQRSIAQAENVRAALTFVARGEAPLGIVYETDARAEPKVAVVARFPEGSHPPILYPAALTVNAGAKASAFLDHLRTGQGAQPFRREGFTVLE